MQVALLLARLTDEPRSLSKAMYARLGLRWRIRLDHAEARIARGALVYVDVGHGSRL